MSTTLNEIKNIYQATHSCWMIVHSNHICVMTYYSSFGLAQRSLECQETPTIPSLRYNFCIVSYSINEDNKSILCLWVLVV
jgi:hypothetical protein